MSVNISFCNDKAQSYLGYLHPILFAPQRRPWEQTNYNTAQ